MRILILFSILMCVKVTYANRLVEYFKGDIVLTSKEIRTLIQQTLKEDASSYEAAIAYYQSGVLYRKDGMNLNAYLSYENSLTILQNLDTTDHLLHAAILQNQGVILKQSGLYQTAIEKYEAGIDPASKYSKKFELSMRYNLGRALAYTDTESSLNQFIELINGNNQKYKARGYREIAKLFVKSMKYDTALYYLEKALAINSNLQEKAWIYHEMANISHENHNYRQQESFLLKAISLNQTGNQFTSLMDLGECYMILGQRDRAEKTLLKAENLPRSLSEENVKIYDWLRAVTDNDTKKIQYGETQIAKQKELIILQKQLQDQYRKVAMVNTIDHINEQKQTNTFIHHLILAGKILFALLAIIGLLLVVQKIRIRNIDRNISKILKIRK